jgi:hypothetical protein
MQKFRNYKKDPNFFRGQSATTVRKRIVNQEEIVDFLKSYPGQTENTIMCELYDFERGFSLESNKKYAECLRRALRSGKISRAKARFQDRYRFIYFAI